MADHGISDGDNQPSGPRAVASVSTLERGLKMQAKLTTCVAVALVLGTMAFGAAAAQGYEGPFWSVGENEVKENLTIKARSTSLTFEDTKMGLGIKCVVSMEGTIGTEGKDEIKSATATECKDVKGCTELPTAKALHLPWKTKLEEIGEVPEDMVLNSGAGQPGWIIECKVLGVPVKDECDGESGAEIENVTGGTNLLFKSGLENLACSIGGAKTGVVTGTELDENRESKQVGAIFLRLTATATGTRKLPLNGTNTCEYTLKFENCTVEIHNISNVPVTITTKQLKGVEATTRYGVTTENCTVGLVLSARIPGQPGGKCDDIVQLLVNPTAGWTNFLTVNARDTPYTASPTAEGNLTTY
jgi:hypothetical protein